MYLFVRSRRLDPGEASAGMEAVVKLTEAARAVTGRQIDAWAAVMSPEVGTIAWTLWAEHLTDIEAAGDALAADSSFAKLVEKVDDHFDGPVTDGLAMLVHGAPDLAGDPPTYVAVVTATAANGRLMDAITGGIEIAEMATKLGGQPTMLAVAATGAYGGLMWMTPSPDIATLEAGEAAVNADPGFMSLVDGFGTAYAPGATQTLYRRIV
ncbi:MAG: hypothetical protein AMXMBFR46_27330 [Acidimicrobiia bacterium]